MSRIDKIKNDMLQPEVYSDVQKSADLLYLLLRIEKLEAVRKAAASLLSEDDAVEALNHYVVLQILREKLDACEGKLPTPCRLSFYQLC